MRFRKLRIAWSIGCGLVAALLMALWVRSFWTLDMVSRIDCRNIDTTFGSLDGTLYLAHFNAKVAYEGHAINPWAPRDWSYESHETPGTYHGQFEWKRGPTSLNVSLPHWSLAISIALIGAAPWFGRRFSLRTLLFVMTLVAVTMGLVVWASRK
jgi:hypothetical protein